MSLTASDFITHAQPQLDAIQARFQDAPPVVSDLVDADGHQYVDIVMEGGGVLGVALLGYLHALERFGIRFLSIGGTSAGSITALLLAAAGRPHEAKTERLAGLLANMPMARFVDGDRDAQQFIDWLRTDARLVDREGWGMRKIWAVGRGLLDGLSVRDNLNDDLGLCPGEAFRQWVAGTLRDFGADTLTALQRIMQPVPDSIAHVGTARRAFPDGVPCAGDDTPRADLCLVAADLSTETKVCFPEHADLYFDAVRAGDPAEYVRASMSIPFFFHPVVAAPPAGNDLAQRWATRLGEDGANAQAACWIPERCILVDGGVMSNFPIDAFHNVYRIPRCPTLGVKLEIETHYTPIASPLGLLLQLFNSARHCRDNDFIARNPDFSHLVQTIDTGEHDWLNFNLEDDAKLDLFRRGVDAAGAWLARFDWANYKEIRAGIMRANEARRTRLART